MQESKETYSKIDSVVSEALRKAPGPKLPDSFTDRLMARIEKRVAAKQVLSEFLLKSAISLVLIVFISGVAFVPVFGNFLESITSLARYRQPLMYIAIIVLFTLLFDQVILRYLLKIRRTNSEVRGTSGNNYTRS